MDHNTCPVCGAKMPGNWAEYPDYPFCSKRCRLIDLGRWLGEGYRIVDPPGNGPAPPPTDRQG